MLSQSEIDPRICVLIDVDCVVFMKKYFSSEGRYYISIMHCQRMLSGKNQAIMRNFIYLAISLKC